MGQKPDQITDAPDRGQVLFAVGFVVFSAMLLSQIGEQTRWAERTLLVAQPRFWPAVGLCGMVLFGVLHWVSLSHRFPIREDGREALRWLLALEWVGWFLVYVTLVPLVGYLPITILFAICLALRIGYRGWRWIGIAAGFGLAVVLLFKTFMGVKIPGAALYEYFPPALRNVFILYF